MFFFKQKTAYEMRISDWSSDVCSSDLEHCQIWRDGDEYRILDLGATNTTRVNDTPVAEAVLADSDHVTVGESILKFISHTSVEANYHEEIYQLATRDALTDLCNRRHFLEQMEREVARTLRHGRPLAMCIVDVDLFKPVNDRYGHISGDEVLRQIAGLIHQHVRHDDIAARIGGEEFAVLLPECDTDAAYGIAARMRPAVAAETFTPGGESQRITISRSEEHKSELQSLMRISYAVFCLIKKHTTRRDSTTQRAT